MERTTPLNPKAVTILPAGFPITDGTQPCAKEDPESFFPDTGEEAAAVRELKKLCRHCPFVQPCATWALEHDEKGFWGGTSERQRKEIRRRRAA